MGGVSKSPVLREQLGNGALGETKIIFPSLKYSTDNAAMIGAAGWWQFTHNGPIADHVGMMPRLSLPLEDGEAEDASMEGFPAGRQESGIDGGK